MNAKTKHILKELKELEELHNSTLDEEGCLTATDSEIDESTQVWNQAMEKLGELIKFVEQDNNA